MLKATLTPIDLIRQMVMEIKDAHKGTSAQTHVTKQKLDRLVNLIPYVDSDYMHGDALRQIEVRVNELKLRLHHSYNPILDKVVKECRKYDVYYTQKERKETSLLSRLINYFKGH